MTMRDMTDDEYQAIEGIRNGDLKPLLAILVREEPDVHPLVQRYLAQIIVGDERVIDFKLKAERHKYIRNSNMGVRGEAKNRVKGMEIAAQMAHNGAFLPGCYEGAIEDTIKATGKRRTTITNAWSDHKDFIRFCIAHGHFEIDDAKRPPGLRNVQLPERIARMPG